MADKKVAVIAVGGNALITDSKHQSVSDQFGAAKLTMSKIAGLISAGWEVIITHGNGPQVGFILARSEFSRGILHEVPLDSCVADTQGAIGYNFQMALANEFRSKGIKKPVVSVVTQVLVDRDDPSFKKPSKPIGQFFPEEEALKRKSRDGWDVAEDAGRGWRRVVASPFPKEIIELEVIKALVDSGVVTIAVGGGGIPVIRDKDGSLKGVAAVIDKDYASALLASKLNADIFIVSTGVEKVYLNFGRPDQKALDRMTVTEAKKYIDEKHFKPGSMLPKIEAAIWFLENGGKEALITDPEHILPAVEGRTGTRMMK